jgi:hypothetical protein
MELKSFAESTMRTNLDGHTVRDLSPAEHDVHIEHLVVEGRSPEKGYHRNGLGIVMVHILSRHGHILINTPEGQKISSVRNGDVAIIDPSEDYAFEGSMTVLHTELPPTLRDTGEYVEEN